MYKSILCLLLIWLFILSGCMNITFNKDERVAAIVRGEEISVGDLRYLYPDEAMMDMMEEVVKAKLAEQEVKKMNIDISTQLKEIKKSYGQYPEDGLNNAKAQSIRSFADSQANKMGMDPKDYYNKYTEASAEMVAYTNVYTSTILGELEDDAYGVEEYNHHANELLDDLAEQNKDAITIRIE